MKKMERVLLSAILVLGAGLAARGGGAPVVERIFRTPRLTRGNTNLLKIQPIDEASWIWDGDDAARVLVFRKAFEVKAGDAPLTLDVSADERFYLTCDGSFVARGPHRGTVENWQYETYRLALAPGRHELRAVVTRLGDAAPLAQLSHRGGFILKADGAYDAQLTTGRAKWQVGRFDDLKPMGIDNGVWGTGAQFEIVGSGPYAIQPASWRTAVEVRGAAAQERGERYGLRTAGWMLFPSQLPDQTETVVRPGVFRAATHAAAWRTNHVYTAAEAKAPEVDSFNRLLKGEPVTVPARTRLQLAWHLGNYYCAYPRLVLFGGRGARVSWTWTESSRNASDGRKGLRGEIVGKYLQGYGDVFVSDGRARAEFSAPWFRSGLWCRIDVETADEPLEISDLALIESRYPLEAESAFESPDDPSLAGIRRIATRAQQMCCHEMLFDCPYYEQQMYPGDTRVQLLNVTALSRDDRLVKRAVEIFDLGTRDDGQCPFNWPTRGTQEGFTYTLCYLCMFGDYAMNHADRAWLKARLPGLRKSMAGCELYENADGLVENTPGWNFMDWVVGWTWNGVLPDSDGGRKLNAFVNLFWLLAVESAATTERALGNELQARYWEEKAARLKKSIVKTFWDESRGLLADLPGKKVFSEHAQALAIVADALPPEKRDVCFRHLVADPDLARTTVYFNYYLFEAYFKMGRADLFQKRLDLWRGYVAKGIATLSEMPDSPEREGRSDCHAWGAHPIWFMQTGLAGIRSAAPFFEKVLVAPQPGSLKSLKARHPHPQGFVEVDLAFDGSGVKGSVRTPVPGMFVFGGCSLPLQRGTNVVDSCATTGARADLTVEPSGLSAKDALACVRAMRAAGDTAPKTIAVKGANRLAETLVFTEADRDLAFVGEGGASFSGGVEISGWRETEPGVWEAAAPKTAKGETMFFDQLWVNGRRAPCARLPNEGWLAISAASQTVAQVGADFTNYLNRVTFDTNDVAVKALAGVPAADLPYLEVGVVNKWAYNLLALGGYAAERNEMTVPSPFDWKSWKHWMRGSSLVAFFNVRTAFDAPGEWFLDVSAGEVRYRPLPGERVPELKFVAPRAGLSRLVDFRGDWRKGRCARNISFDNIAFEHTSAPMTANRPGLVDQLQAASTFDGAVTAEGVRNISFTRCRVAHTGNYAMRFNSSCVSNAVVDCTLEDLGAGGVWMGASYRFCEKKAEIPRKVLPPMRADATAFNLISNCTIRAGGRYNPEGTGVALTHCSDTKVVHCDISDMMYTGISVGWTWGFSGSVAQRNEIAYNRIWDLGKGVMSDMGGVYMLGTSFGTTVHDNVIHGVRSYSYGGWGLYADEGSEGIVFERNLCWDTTDGGFHQHYGTGCIVRNNIFAWNRRLGAVRMCRAVVQDIPCTLHFVNNIVIVREGPLCGEGVRKVGGIWANNLWWDVRGEKAATFDGLAWSDWKASGKETGSFFADPLFADPNVGDGRLRPDSPAFALGFKPFDSAKAGRK